MTGPARRTPEYVWHPLAVGEAQRLFEPLSIPWWIAGGWAIELHLGRQTREHADIDVSIVRRDHHALRALCDDFELHIAHDGALIPWSGDELAPEHHQFWARRHGEIAWAFEVLLEDHAGDVWLYRRDHRITLPLDRVGRRDGENVPYVAPEIALLYKSNRPHHENERNAADFDSALPVLSPDERTWLIEALSIVHGAHPWAERLRIRE